MVTFGRKIMNIDKKQDLNSREFEHEQKPAPDRSPDEELVTAPGVGSVVPGAENPDSEIKQETGPNTE